MLAITHLIVSLLLIQVLLLDKNDAFVALLFGFAIDADHLIGLHKYVGIHGLAGVTDISSLMHPEGQWRSMLHNPIAAAVVGPLSVVSRAAIPIVFWGLHLLMDSVAGAIGDFSVLEAAILAFAAIALLAIRYGEYLKAASKTDFVAYAFSEIRQLRISVSPGSS
jgi:hypothetical protein